MRSWNLVILVVRVRVAAISEPRASYHTSTIGTFISRRHSLTTSITSAYTMQRIRKAAKWTQQDRRWRRVDATNPLPDYSKYNVKADIPEYDEATYEQHLQHDDWTRAETDYLVELYQECNGKWPVIWDHYEFEDKTRSMEELKARFYKISAQLLQLRTPIQSMGTSEFELYTTLNTFDPAKEESRKSLAKGHLYRKANEVDEETVLLAELQRIMLNQATLDAQREELRRRLDYPHAATNGYQYSTSQALTQLWQQLLQQDRMKKNPRLKATGTFCGPLLNTLPSACDMKLTLSRKPQLRWLCAIRRYATPPIRSRSTRQHSRPLRRRRLYSRSPWDQRRIHQRKRPSRARTPTPRLPFPRRSNSHGRRNSPSRIQNFRRNQFRFRSTHQAPSSKKFRTIRKNRHNPLCRGRSRGHTITHAERRGGF